MVIKISDGNSKPAIIYALHLIQKENKYIESKHINAVADLLNLKEIDVYEVASHFTLCLSLTKLESIQFLSAQMFLVC